MAASLKNVSFYVIFALFLSFVIVSCDTDSKKGPTFRLYKLSRSRRTNDNKLQKRFLEYQQTNRFNPHIIQKRDFRDEPEKHMSRSSQDDDHYHQQEAQKNDSHDRNSYKSEGNNHMESNEHKNSNNASDNFHSKTKDKSGRKRGKLEHKHSAKNKDKASIREKLKKVLKNQHKKSTGKKHHAHRVIDDDQIRGRNHYVDGMTSDFIAPNRLVGAGMDLSTIGIGNVRSVDTRPIAIGNQEGIGVSANNNRKVIRAGKGQVVGIGPGVTDNGKGGIVDSSMSGEFKALGNERGVREGTNMDITRSETGVIPSVSGSGQVRGINSEQGTDLTDIGLVKPIGAGVGLSGTKIRNEGVGPSMSNTGNGRGVGRIGTGQGQVRHVAFSGPTIKNGYGMNPSLTDRKPDTNMVLSSTGPARVMDHEYDTSGEPLFQNYDWDETGYNSAGTGQSHYYEYESYVPNYRLNQGNIKNVNLDDNRSGMGQRKAVTGYGVGSSANRPSYGASIKHDKNETLNGQAKAFGSGQASAIGREQVNGFSSDGYAPAISSLPSRGQENEPVIGKDTALGQANSLDSGQDNIFRNRQIIVAGDGKVTAPDSGGTNTLANVQNNALETGQETGNGQASDAGKRQSNASDIGDTNAPDNRTVKSLEIGQENVPANRQVSDTGFKTLNNENGILLENDRAIPSNNEQVNKLVTGNRQAKTLDQANASVNGKVVVGQANASNNKQANGMINRQANAPSNGQVNDSGYRQANVLSNKEENVPNRRPIKTNTPSDIPIPTNKPVSEQFTEPSNRQAKSTLDNNQAEILASKQTNAASYGLANETVNNQLNSHDNGQTYASGESIKSGNSPSNLPANAFGNIQPNGFDTAQEVSPTENRQIKTNTRATGEGQASAIGKGQIDTLVSGNGEMITASNGTGPDVGSLPEKNTLNTGTVVPDDGKITINTGMGVNVNDSTSNADVIAVTKETQTFKNMFSFLLDKLGNFTREQSDSYIDSGKNNRKGGAERLTGINYNQSIILKNTDRSDTNNEFVTKKKINSDGTEYTGGNKNATNGKSVHNKDSDVLPSNNVQTSEIGDRNKGKDGYLTTSRNDEVEAVSKNQIGDRDQAMSLKKVNMNEKEEATNVKNTERSHREEAEDFKNAQNGDTKGSVSSTKDRDRNKIGVGGLKNSDTVDEEEAVGLKNNHEVSAAESKKAQNGDEEDITVSKGVKNHGQAVGLEKANKLDTVVLKKAQNFQAEDGKGERILNTKLKDAEGQNKIDIDSLEDYSVELKNAYLKGLKDAADINKGGVKGREDSTYLNKGHADDSVIKIVENTLGRKKAQDAVNGDNRVANNSASFNTSEKANSTDTKELEKKDSTQYNSRDNSNDYTRANATTILNIFGNLLEELKQNARSKNKTDSNKIIGRKNHKVILVRFPVNNTIDFKNQNEFLLTKTNKIYYDDVGDEDETKKLDAG